MLWLESTCANRSERGPSWCHISAIGFRPVCRIVIANYEPGWPETVWHYSSMDGLRGIVQSRALRATDTRRMKKDPTEFLYPRRVAIRVVKRLQEVSNSSYERWFLAMCEVIADAADEGPTVFAACASGVADHRSQWNEFADEGTGFAIGLNRRAFYDAAAAQGYSLFTVIYDTTEQERFLERQVHDGAQELLKLDGTMERGPRMALLMGLAISFPLMFLKDPKYSSEHEWRIGRLETRLCDEPPPLPKGVWDDGAEYEVVALDNPESEESSITEVVAGPSVTHDSVQEAQNLLELHGLGHIEVRRSALS